MNRSLVAVVALCIGSYGVAFMGDGRWGALIIVGLVLGFMGNA